MANENDLDLRVGEARAASAPAGETMLRKAELVKCVPPAEGVTYRLMEQIGRGEAALRRVQQVQSGSDTEWLFRSLSGLLIVARVAHERLHAREAELRTSQDEAQANWQSFKRE